VLVHKQLERHRQVHRRLVLEHKQLERHKLEHKRLELEHRLREQHRREQQQRVHSRSLERRCRSKVA
jgi:hypothetical protein